MAVLENSSYFLAILLHGKRENVRNITAES